MRVRMFNAQIHTLNAVNINSLLEAIDSANITFVTQNDVKLFNQLIEALNSKWNFICQWTTYVYIVYRLNDVLNFIEH